MFVSFIRVFKFAMTDFYRNKGISLAAVFILIITVLLVTSLFLGKGMSDYLIIEIQNKIDITAYFKPDASEENILAIRDKIIQISPNIKTVEYVSKEKALKIFNSRYADNTIFREALAQVGENPFLPSLNINTGGEASEYEQVAKILQSEQFSEMIDKVDFSQKKATIERVFSVTSKISWFGLGLAVFLVLIAVLVVFNTIKLAIQNSKDEISTMRVVGAANWFVRAPFIIQGALFGFVAFLVCFAITVSVVYFASPFIHAILPGFNLFNYFVSNLWLIIFLQLFCGIGLGSISSLIVVNKYLKI